MRCLLSVLFTLLPCVSSETLMRKDIKETQEKRGVSNSAVALAGSGQIRRMHSKAKNEMCNSAYVEGLESSDLCAKHGHVRVDQAGMCQEAAHEKGVPTLPENDEPDAYGGFFTHREQFYKRPKGCYKAPCVIHGEEKHCYYFNKAPLFPQQPGIVGTPICSRPRFVNGTVNSDGMTNSSCPPDYDVISDQLFCSEAASCLGITEGSQPSDDSERTVLRDLEYEIGVNNRTEHDLYPQGCFIHLTLRGLFFNPKRPMLDGNDWVPGQPTGMPLCTVAGERGAQGFTGASGHDEAGHDTVPADIPQAQPTEVPVYIAPGGHQAPPWNDRL